MPFYELKWNTSVRRWAAVEDFVVVEVAYVVGHATVDWLVLAEGDREVRREAVGEGEGLSPRDAEAVVDGGSVADVVPVVEDVPERVPVVDDVPASALETSLAVWPQ